MVYYYKKNDTYHLCESGVTDYDVIYQKIGNKFYSYGVGHIVYCEFLGDKHIDLSGKKIGDVQLFNPELIDCRLHYNNITHLPRCLPNTIQLLYLHNNKINNLTGCVFPNALKKLTLCENPLNDLRDVVFPPLLENLFLQNIGLTNLIDVNFPASLRVLWLSNNKITTIANIRFPSKIEDLKIENNPINEFSGVFINPLTPIWSEHKETIRTAVLETCSNRIKRFYLRRYKTKVRAAIKIQMWWTALSFYRRGETYKNALMRLNLICKVENE